MVPLARHSVSPIPLDGSSKYLPCYSPFLSAWATELPSALPRPPYRFRVSSQVVLNRFGMGDEMGDNFMSLEEQEEYRTMIAMRFKTENEGFLFYNRYVKNKGFSVRKNYARRDPVTAAVTLRQYQCSREGYRKEVYMDVTNRTREPKALTDVVAMHFLRLN